MQPKCDLLALVQMIAIAFSEKPPVCTKTSFNESQQMRIQRQQSYQAEKSHQELQQVHNQQHHEQPSRVNVNLQGNAQAGPFHGRLTNSS